MLHTRAVFCIFAFNLLFVKSHVILPSFETENSKFNAFIDDTENSHVNNSELQHSETTEDSGKF